jgi:RNA polymerase sigma-70 factor (sigma-E family)
MLASVFARQYAPMVRLAGFLLGEAAAAEDIVQEAFARLHPRLEALSEPDRVDAYLRKIVVNLSRNWWRRRRLGHRSGLARPDSVDDGSTARSDRAEIVAALAKLPRRQRECLALRYYLDLPESEIAAALGLSVGSVKTHVSRGLAGLGRLLGENHES